MKCKLPICVSACIQHAGYARQKQHDEASEIDEDDRNEIPFLHATVGLYRSVYALARDLSSEQIWRKQR